MQVDVLGAFYGFVMSLLREIIMMMMQEGEKMITIEINGYCRLIFTLSLRIVHLRNYAFDALARNARFFTRVVFAHQF
jgi:hypothetical protein